MFIASLALSLVLFQDPPVAQPTPQTPAEIAAAEEEAEEEAHMNEIICRREHVVGSNRPQRICQTRRQWNGLRERSIDNLNNNSNRSYDAGTPTATAGR